MRKTWDLRNLGPNCAFHPKNKVPHRSMAEMRFHFGPCGRDIKGSSAMNEC